MPQQRVKRHKAITVASVMAFFFAFITAAFFAPGNGDEEFNILGTFVFSAMIYFALIYPLVLISIGLFKDSKTETGTTP